MKTTSGTLSPTSTLDLSQAGNGDKGETVTVDVIPNDGFGSGAAATDSAVVANTAPVVDSVAIDQGAPHTNDTLTVTATAHDVDGGDTLAYGYQWLKDGSPIFGATGATLDLSVLGNGDRGEGISVDVTADDATATSPALRSAAVTILDSAPSAAVTLSPASPLTNDTLAASATGSDPDLDPVTLAYAWTVAGGPVAGATGSSLDLGPRATATRGRSSPST